MTSTISLAAGISAAAARNSSMVPNGSAVPCVNTVGTLTSGRCSVLPCPDRNAVLFSDRLASQILKRLRLGTGFMIGPAPIPCPEDTRDVGQYTEIAS